ncbi:MAG: hypothetical protein KBB91_01880 [Candidatus Pacebacteria bacterium]|jgi:hypothetical protein|nr:hypothetical protein [Candidatus Paceibacterota bacterium]MBP9701151.1 hypothetical protein [Candidatus Paceibacterota bacterium]
MKPKLPVSSLLIEKPFPIFVPGIVKTPGVTKSIPCGEAMVVAARIAIREELPFIKFEHPHPPSFLGRTMTTEVVMVDTEVVRVPRQLVHVSQSEIDEPRFVKLVPTWKELLRDNIKK